MNLDERMESLKNKLNNRLSGNNSYTSSLNTSVTAPGTTGCNSQTETLIMFCPECGNKVEKESNFCPNCGYNFNDAMNAAEMLRPSKEEKYSSHNGCDSNAGIIMTDTFLLANKYGVDRYDVLKIVNQFIQSSKAIGFNWYLLDIADHRNDIGKATWMDYSDVLVHIFVPEDRTFYNLENLWADARLNLIPNLE